MNNNIDPEDAFICYKCIGETYLSKEIESEDNLVTCSYCEDEAPGSTLPELAERIDVAFEQHYDRQSESHPDDWPLELIKLQGDDWEPNGEPIIYAIMNAVHITEEIASDVQTILEEKHYSQSSAEIGETSDCHKNSYYDTRKPNDLEWNKKWLKFEENLQSKTRFFSKVGLLHLQSVFQHINHLNTHDGKPVVKTIGPNTDIDNLYRARVFQSEAKLKTALESPDVELGPPPPKLARAGRMNANGISVFYGATKAHTATAEVRPPVGSKVVVAKFDVVRSLRLLDLSVLSSITVNGSIFDNYYAALLSRISFLRKLSQRMTRPVMPDDENFEYLPTQAIADFLASEMDLDGIMFPSAQSNEGLNIVLFNHAAKVEEIIHPKATSVKASLYDWEEYDMVTSYSVRIETPEPISKVEDNNKYPWDYNITLWQPVYLREVSLAIDTSSIKVEHINSVKVESTTYEVTFS